MTNLMHTLFYNTPATIPYMFRALHAHRQEVNRTDAASGIVLSVSGRAVHGCTARPLSERTIPDAASVRLTS